MIRSFTIATDKPDQTGDILLLAGVKIPGRVLLTKEFDHRRPLGMVEIVNTGSALVATGEVADEFLDHTPAIGFQVIKSHIEGEARLLDEVKLWYVGLSTSPNVDPSIKTIREQIIDT